MKTLLSSVLIALAPVLAFAETPAQAPAKATSAKTHSAKAKTAGSKVAVAKAHPPTSREHLKSVASQVATGMSAADAALSPAELAIAERVYVGRIPCELGAYVTVAADAAAPGHFNLEGKGFKYHMVPVATSTGAVRLEDPKGGAVWLQIANKSMLMNQKLGQRLADECMSSEQVVVAEAHKKNPPPGVLDALPGTR